MRVLDESLELSASDLAHFLACRHRTSLDLAVARGLRVAPGWVDPSVAALLERGLEHEHRYLDQLRAEGLTVVDLSNRALPGLLDDTRSAMVAGSDVIAQGAIRNGRWFGRPDVLRRVETPSDLGAWSYEVFDAKLAKETRGGTILQLSLYSELVGDAQRRAPEFFHVVTPDLTKPVRTFRVQDYAGYFRHVRNRLGEFVAQDPLVLAAENYPEPVEHCAVCRWWQTCTARRRDDDHLSFVAGISRLQTRELEAASVSTLISLAQMPLPFRPKTGAPETYVRVREQARVQHQGRKAQQPVHEVMPRSPTHGFARLPAPTAGDIFLDLEGDPYARDGGREYLFGVATLSPQGAVSYHGRWAYSDRDERAAFERTIDMIIAARATDPGIHVYHYAPYEPVALKRLMGRYSSREADVDALLRDGAFVDLYAVVRNAIRASVERYSLKDLEPFYAFQRSTPLTDARSALRIVERALEIGAPERIPRPVRDAVESYNKDDCVSVARLQLWLERLRAEDEARNGRIDRPSPPPTSTEKPSNDRARAALALRDTLLIGIPDDPLERSDEENSRWLLAQLLEWHRREAKAPWWEYFRLRDLPEHELFDERAALAGLSDHARVGGTTKSPVDRYHFPVQESELVEGDLLHLTDGRDLGTLERIDLVARTIDIKKRGALAEMHPTAVFAHSVVNTTVLADSIFRVASNVSVGQSRVDGPAFDLLARRRPRLDGAPFQQRSSEDASAFAVRIAPLLDRTVLPIQGPPGAGKTFTAARMICSLVAAGKRVGVTAVSHRVIRNLLDATAAAAAAVGVSALIGQKVAERHATPSPTIEEHTDNGEVIDRLADGRLNVVGATSWLWAREDAANIVDVLFVDEAGQISLANAVAVSQAASSLVLLGDPQQLEQPQQGSHPIGVDVSALEHLLAGRKTITADRGIFLSETWRLAPTICRFTSELFYEGRLTPRPDLAAHAVDAPTAGVTGSGLFSLQVSHSGNRSASGEEATAVFALASNLLTSGTTWIDRHGVRHPLTAADLLVIAPYNAHVALIHEKLATLGIRVGTVDKFQGQEAAVAIYSLATSVPEDAPHGMEFLYSLNRLNVATSRARCACILVSSPRIFEPECSSPRQMHLANAFCRFVELARPIIADMRVP